MKQEFVTLNYRPLRDGERYCPACGADTLRREPDGTVYYVGHSEANCYKRQLSQARAEADHYRQQYEALRAGVERVVQDLHERTRATARDWRQSGHPYHDGASDAYGEAFLKVRRVLADHGGDDAES